MSFIKIPVEKFEMSPFKPIGKEWMLITAGNKDKVNTMTASWGGLGIMWNKPVAFCFIRPQRYTLEFVEREDYFTCSFFEGEMQEELAFCGKYSGRDKDKIKETGLSPVFDAEAPYFQQAKTVFVCRKLYSQDMLPERFIDKDIEKFYPDKDYHRYFIGEIVKVLKNNG